MAVFVCTNIDNNYRARQCRHTLNIAREIQRAERYVKVRCYGGLRAKRVPNTGPG